MLSSCSLFFLQQKHIPTISIFLFPKTFPLYWWKEEIGYLSLQIFIIAQHIILSFIGPTGILLETELQISKWDELKLPTKLNFWKMGKKNNKHWKFILENTQTPISWLFQDFYMYIAVKFHILKVNLLI